MGKNAQQKTGTILVRPSVVREFSSGGVVFKKEKGEVLWLVCKSNPSEKYPDYWRLPKGWIDDRSEGLSPGPMASGEKKAGESDLVVTALREVGEEGGINAKIIKKIGTFRYFIGRGLKFVTFYLMEFVRNLPEGFGMETEKIEWLPVDKAVARLSRKEEKEVLQKAATLLDSGVQSNLPL